MSESRKYKVDETEEERKQRLTEYWLKDQAIRSTRNPVERRSLAWDGIFISCMLGIAISARYMKK